MNKSSDVHDLIIVGAGPAGITAAVYAARKKMDFIVITVNVGGQVAISSMVENYTGFQYITGEDLAAKFQDHMERYKFGVKMEEVQKVEKDGQLFKVTTNKRDYLSKTLLVATGRKPRELKVQGEAKLKNRGITYCATCDGPLFEGLDVAVVGGGNSGLEAVIQLIKIAKNIYLFDRESQLKADSVLIEKAKASDKVKIWLNTQVKEIEGDNVVNGIRVDKDGQESLIPVQGVFVEIGSVPSSDVADFVEKNRSGEIIVDCKCETSVPGLFAAGDVTNVPQKQIVVAAGEGCKAVLSAFKYLSRSK